MAKKKFIKKHHFVHADPEREAIAEKTSEKKLKSIEKKDTGGYTTEFISIDLKRTIIMIGIFVLLLLALYITQIKTSFFIPILKKFGL